MQVWSRYVTGDGRVLPLSKNHSRYPVNTQLVNKTGGPDTILFVVPYEIRDLEFIKNKLAVGLQIAVADPEKLWTAERLERHCQDMFCFFKNHIFNNFQVWSLSFASMPNVCHVEMQQDVNRIYLCSDETARHDAIALFLNKYFDMQEETMIKYAGKVE